MEDTHSQIMSLILLGLIFGSPRNYAYKLPPAPSQRFTGIENKELHAGRISSQYSSVPVSTRLWPGGSIPFKIDLTLEPMRHTILEAMHLMHSRTCVRFVEAESDTRDYIYITQLDGCWSSVGYKIGVQELSLGHSCGDSLGVVMHELMHVLGFWHEHARADRDNNVEIHWDNIQEGQKHNFFKMYPWESNLLDESFDFDSVMMYGSLAYSKDGASRTVTSKNSENELVAVAGKPDLSPGDIRKINKLYECNGETRPNPLDVPALVCHFEEDDCGFSSQNDPRTVNWVLVNDGEGGMSLSSKDEHHQGEYVAGRLFSPHLKNFQRDQGCLSFKFRQEGLSLKHLSILRQTETELRPLFETTAQLENSGVWQEMSLAVPMEEDFRFVIQGLILADTRDDVMTVDDLVFEWKPCS